MFWNNRNKQKTNRNSSKFLKISKISPYHKFCLFWLFRYRSKTSKQTETNWEKIFLLSRKSKPKNNQNRLSFGSNWEKNFTVSRTLLIENIFLRFFWFVLTKFCFFWLLRYQSETPKQTKTNRTNVFWFHKTNRKTTETDWVSVCFGSNRNKNFTILRTPYVITILYIGMLNMAILDAWHWISEICPLLNIYSIIVDAV